MARRMRGDAAAVAVGWVVGMAAIVLIQPQWLGTAQAQAGRTCLNAEGFTLGEEVTPPSGAAQDDNSRGTISNIAIPITGNIECQRISSVYVVSSNYGSRYEFGWVQGYVQCNNNTTFYQAARLFYTYTNESGGTGCFVYTGSIPAEGTYRTFRVSGIGTDHEYKGYYEGAVFSPTIIMDFVEGRNAIGAERALPIAGVSAGDVCSAKFHNLNEWHTGNDWTVWNGLKDTGGTNSNPGCFLDVLNTYTGDVKAN